MESKPLVSIIIPVYNSGKYLAEAIDSALEQTYNNREIIVVDDGSTDNTRELVGQYEDRVRYIYQENQGLAGARNTGIKNAKGEYLQFLDADDLILPKKLEMQVDFLESNSDYAVAYSDIRYFNGFDRTKLIKMDTTFHSGDILKMLLIENNMPVHTPLIRKICSDNIDLFQARFNPCEDWDFWLRMAYAGYKFYYIDKVLALYRRHGDNMSLDRLRMARAGLEVVKSVDNYIHSESSKKDLGIRRALAQRYQYLGEALLDLGRYIEGWQEIIRSVLLYPVLQSKALVKGLLIFFLGKKSGEKIVKLLKKIKPG